MSIGLRNCLMSAGLDTTRGGIVLIGFFVRIILIYRSGKKFRISQSSFQDMVIEGITVELRNRGHLANSKKVRRFMKEDNLLCVKNSQTANHTTTLAESLIKTLKCEEVYLNEYGTFKDALQNIDRFIEEVYNSKRLHSSIGYKSPINFE